MENHSEQKKLGLENKRLLELLKASEGNRIKDRFLLQKLNFFNEKAPLAVIEWDLNAYITSWNQSAENIFGFTKKTAVGKKASDLIIPESSKNQTYKIWESFYENPKGTKYTIENITKDDEIITCEWYSIPNINEKGKIEGFSNMAFKIDKKVINTAEPDESSDRYKMLSELTFEGIIIHKNGIVIEVNSSLEQLTLYSREEIIDKNVIDLLIPDEFKKMAQENIKNDVITPYEIQLLRKDGVKIWVEVEAKNINYQGQELRTVAIRNIQLRKYNEQVRKVIYEISRASNFIEDVEEFINQIQEQLSTIINTKNFFIGTCNEDESSFQPFHMTDEFEKINDQIPKRSLSEYVIRNQEPLLLNKRQITNLAKSGEIDLNGNKCECWLGVPLISKGKAIGILGVQSYDNPKTFTEKDMDILISVSHQISLSIERKRNELELRKALYEAQESDRLKSTFLSTISHELRTPLNAVIGFSDLIDESMDITEAASLSKMIYKSGNHLLEIINDIFDLSILEEGTLVLVKEKHNLHALLDEIKEYILQEKRKMNKTELNLLFKLDPANKNLQINTDAKRFKQIFIHLLKNALKYTKVGQIEVGYSLSPDSIKFYVKDTGIGISKEKQKHIFELFRQLDDTHTREYEGVGIGLTIAKTLCENLGGKISLNSEKGEGSTFYFTIPFENIKSKKEVESYKSIIDLSIINGKTILIAEDDTASFELLDIYLKPWKVKILWAKNGVEAIDIFSTTKHIDLILMDIKMPVLSGYEAIKEIKLKSPSIPIIAQTAFAVNSEKEIAIEAGCDDYISKPISWKVLSEKMALHLNKRKNSINTSDI